MITATYVPQLAIQRAATIARTEGLGAITAHALAEYDQLSTVVARERLDELVLLGYMDRQAILIGYPDLYTPTLAGRELARRHRDIGGYTYPERIRAAHITIKDARHTIACVSAAGALQCRYPDHRIIGERELRLDERTQGCRLASVEIRREGIVGSHFPDLVIWPPATPGEPPPLPIAAEIELTIKSKKALAGNLMAWARCPYVEAVLYYIETSKVERRILALIEELKVEDAILLNPLGELIKPLPGFDLSRG
jgi:hypothetical protein